MGLTSTLYGPRKLTPRQEQVAGLVAEGMSSRQIGKELGVTEQTIKNYLQIIFDKLGVWNRTEVAVWVVNHRDG